jgi:nicotinamidase-related amidase
MNVTESLTPDNTTIVLIDYAVGFANLFRSHTVAENVRAATALARTAQAFDTGLVVTHGQDSDGPGPIYPQLTNVLGDQPIIRRAGEFNAFDYPDFAEAVKNTGRSHLAIAGLMTEGCVLFTVLGALQRGYSVSVVVDASAGETHETHEAAVQRMTQLGVVPVTWLSLATEFQVSWGSLRTVQQYTRLITEYSPQLGMSILTAQAAAHTATIGSTPSSEPAHVER